MFQNGISCHKHVVVHLIVENCFISRHLLVTSLLWYMLGPFKNVMSLQERLPILCFKLAKNASKYAEFM